MRAKHLGNLLPAQPLYRLHPLPECNRLPGIVASLRHHHQANVVGLALLLAAHGQVEQQILQIIPSNHVPQAEQRQTRQRPGKEEETTGCEIAHPCSRESLCSMGSCVVCDFVTEDSREGIFAAANVENAAVDKDFATWDNKRVCRSYCIAQT